jgi:lipid-binding SYLF domain-containing protein
MLKFLSLIAAALVCAATTPAAFADTKTDERLVDARQVLETFIDIKEQAIPTWLLQRAYGIVVVPRVIKGALIVGGRGGKGVFAVRNPDGTWTNPVFVTLAGANIGFQWGVQSTDVVLVLTSRESVEGMAGGKVTLGADASVAAGPVGRSAAATTDTNFNAQVLSYSRSEGIFAGVALDGSVIAIDDKSNEAAYGISGILPSQILEGKVTSTPQTAADFIALLSRATNAPNATHPAVAGAAASPAATTSSAPTAETPGAAASTAPAQGSEATTFPMEDPAPGAPPPQ